MGKIGEFDRQRMHTQLFGKANFKDLTSREDILRFRKINSTLGVIAILLIGYFILSLRFGMNELAIWSGIIGAVLLIILLFRLGFIKKKIFKRTLQKKKSGGGWIRIGRLPSWALKKMRRKKANRVNGKHYTYKREKGKFYKKRR